MNETTDGKTIKWYGDGIYSKMRRGPDGGPVEEFFIRLWIPAERKMRVWRAGPSLERAQAKRDDMRDDRTALSAKREADRVVAQAVRAERHKQAAAVVTFKVTVTRFLASPARAGGGADSSDWYNDILRASLETFGDLPVQDVTPRVLESYVSGREKLTRKSDGGRRVSDSSIRKELIALGTVFKWARRQGLVLTNPADAESMPRPKEILDPQGARWLRDGELKGLLAVCPPWLRTVIAWATETGMDKGKIRGLRWQELDLDRVDGKIVAGRFAMLRDKTGKPIRQVLSDGAIEALNQARKVRSAAGLVFLDADGHAIEEKPLDWAVGCAYTAAKITGCNFRTFRHTFATRSLRRGVPREAVALTMGHSTAYITERYMHVADDQLEAAARALSGPERLTAIGQMAP
jgi:integrase